MYKTQTKNLSAIITILLLTSAFVAISNTQPAKAQNNTQWTAFMHVSAAPNPVGVGQTTLVTWSLDKVSPIATIRANQWQGIMVTITKPDGTVETKGPLEAWSTGGSVFFYTPTMLGTYKIEASFPGQWVNGSYTSISTAYGNWQNTTGQPLIYENRYYKPCTGSTVLTVQQEQIQGITSSPVPQSYWTRPILDDNKGWYEFTDNWLMQGYDRSGGIFSSFGTAFAPYTAAPESPHILWKQPVQTGGMVGGAFGDKSYYTGLTYETLYVPYVLNGRIIYVDHGLTSTAAHGTRCIDLYTGEEIWYLNNTGITFCQTLSIDTGNEHGILAYMWSISGQNWIMYDAFNARMLLNLTGMPTGGTYKQGPNGEILYYVLNVAQKTLTMWNSTRAIAGHVFDTWSPTYGGTINASRAAGASLTAMSRSPFMGVEWNVTIPTLLNTTAIALIDEGYLLAATNFQTSWPPIYNQVAFDLNLQRDASGAYPESISYLWIANRTNIMTHRQAYSKNIGEGIFAFWDEGACQLIGYDIRTGRELWKTQPINTGWGHFLSGLHIAYGKAYMGNYDGRFRAYDIRNGNLVFEYYCGNAGYLTPYGCWPVNSFTIADRKIFLTNDEHSPDSILWTGAKLWCIDADTGQSLWNLSSRLRQATVVDGILTAFNLYDNSIYTLGKGPSKTTVSAPMSVTPLGQSVMITGTVTDQTPAIKDTPAISDKNMDEWMSYLYLQKPKPKDVTGVPVTISAIDPNGNTQEIGAVTSDSMGNFGIIWTPPVQGQYQIMATFDGTKSYYGSETSTYFGVGPAAATPQPTATPTATPEPTVAPTATPTVSPSVVPEPQALPSTDLYVIAAAAAVVIVIVAVAAVILRKRK